MLNLKRKAALAGILAGLLLLGALGVKKLRWHINAEWNPFEESAAFLANEERGFYVMSGMVVSEEAARQRGLPQQQGEETLELIQIHLGEYRDGPVGPKGLEQIRNALDSRRETGRRLILRFLYDWEGKGMESDPSSLSVVLTHMEQMGELLEDYKDLVYIVQGVFVGSWAEMHSSRYLTPDQYQTLIQTMDRVMPREIFLGVRTPAYWRMGVGRQDPVTWEEARGRETLASRLSLFNDGMLGNSLDCGTYGDVKREESLRLTDKWTREDELAFQEELNLYLPNGGEAVLDNPLNDFEEARAILERTHVSYLNRDHDLSVLDKWKAVQVENPASVYDGLTGYDYMERHLGYRFVIRQAGITSGGWCWTKPELTLQVENVGFAGRYTPCQVSVILRPLEGGETLEIPLDTDLRDWLPGTVSLIRVPLDLEAGKEYEVSLLAKGEISGKPVLFANEEIVRADGSCLLGKVRMMK